ncbi:neuropilin-2-like isoform X1 [Brienomyrus brachyistius]|uniref:neuropilin-2-like isoform X1 n=1 Tax=Brienomyrus brachyistius TaxID=42636 RepID=UPI0020B246F3|nr:neuropilin-2-like isoform X1 [Brienomyrus brachyistius]
MDHFTMFFGFLLHVCLTTTAARGEGEPCGGHLDASVPGYITSPGYPHEYPPHQSCRWVITAPEPSQRITLNFNPHFELERLDCRYDFIEIRDGNSESADLLGKHCSNIAPPPLISSGPMVHIKFVSDYAHQGAGFSLRYEILKIGSDCSQNFTSPWGMIESPGYPDKYPHNLECTFIIIVPPRLEVTLTFLTFDLENDPLLTLETECKYDWLEVWDGLPQVGPLIGRYCGTKAPPEITSSTGILSLTFHTDMAVAKDGFSARYNMTPKEVSDTFHCSSPFGMESGKISDSQITASSSFSDGRWTPQQARLNNDDNGWTPSEDNVKEYIQVDLSFLRVLTGIATQGAVSKDTQRSYFVTTFKLEVSTNGEDWMIYRHGKNQKIFHANTDPTEVVLNRIPQPVLARFVRIRPQTWKNGIALRFELYGCLITDAQCSEMQGMMSGLLPESQISASSARDIHWSSGSARLIASRSGWFPEMASPVAGTEWLQVDLGMPKMVRGVITQGARGGESSTSTDNRAFVRKYRVAHSMNGRDWSLIIDSKTGLPKIFEGNTHYDTPEIRRFEEVPAQFIRIYPEKWSPGGIGMRLEVLGCDLPETIPVTDKVTPTLPRSAASSTTQSLWPVPTAGPSYPPSLCDFERGLCGWSHDPAADLRWALHSGGSTTGLGPSQDLSLGIGGIGSFLYVEASPRAEGRRARLVSPEVRPQQGELCLIFSYQLWGEGMGHLRVLLRDTNQEETLIWALKGDQGPVWKEGRTVLPHSPKEYQVIMEGFFDHGNRGHIWLDNMDMSSSTMLEDCTQPFAAFPPFMTDQRPVDIEDERAINTKKQIDGGLPFLQWSTPGPSGGPPVTRVSEKDSAWLYTLDPILVTIIVMSSLGVLLGAVCAGLLLYCSCSYGSLGSRGSTTLENYNFELYDGIKHKVKINQQRCCTEA